MEKETSCINSRAILDYVKEHNKGDCSGLIRNLCPEIDSLPDPESFLRDPNNWISCAVLSKLHERARLILQDETLGYKLGKYSVEKTSLGYAQRIVVKAFWSTKKGLKNIQKINDQWNRSKKVELVEIKRNQAIIRLHWDPKMDVSKDMCLMNQGAYASMPRIWGGRPMKLTERHCFFEEAPFCEYHLKWPVRNRFYEVLSRFSTSKSVFTDTIMEMEEDKKIIEQKYEEVSRLNVELNKRISQLSAIQETGKAILSVLDLDKLLTIIMTLLSNVCGINRAIIMLVNEDKGYLEFIHAIGFEGEGLEKVKNYTVPLDRVTNMLARVVNTGRPEYIPNVEVSNLRKDNIILAYGKPTSIYAVPLITRSKVIGVLATDAVDDEGVPKETREILETFSPQIAIAIENARLYSRLQEQMDELKKSHALLSRAEKFAFLGNVAAGLTHEIKNPLTAIGTFLQMLPRKYNHEKYRTKYYELAKEELNRVNNLLTELLDLAKAKESRFEINDLHDLIEKMILLVSPHSKKKMIVITRQFDSDILKVSFDFEKMKQVILNILLNAVESTPEGGRIQILTKNGTDKEKPRRISIEISDNGSGIPESMIDNIFDPYFTTKHKSSMHSGTGIGLYIAHQKIQDHGGNIEVRSKVGEGTTFVVTFPIDHREGLHGNEVSGSGEN